MYFLHNVATTPPTHVHRHPLSNTHTRSNIIIIIINIIVIVVTNIIIIIIISSSFWFKLKCKRN